MDLVMGRGADMVRGGMLIRRRSWTWRGGAPADNLPHYTPTCAYCLAAVKDITFIPIT